MIKDIRTLRFGVNYTPTGNWYYCWNDFDAGSIARDLDSIAGLEADHIRLPLIWPYFQPNPAFVCPAHLEHLRVLMALARERGLDVCLSMLNGWLSGYAFRQAFEVRESVYTSERLWNAQELYFRKVSDAVREFANFMCFDFGNEMNCCWQAPDVRDGDRWHERMMRLTHELFPDRAHVNGIDDIPWFEPETFSPRTIAKTQSIIALHCWAFFTGAIEQDNGNLFGKASIHLIDLMAALARAFAGDPVKPIWVQEYGMCADWMPTKDIPRFLEEATLNGIRGGASWFTWWTSHDIDRSFAFESLEYSLGLIGNDQKIKPQGEVFRELARTYRRRPCELDAARTLDVSPPQQHNRAATWEWLLALDSPATRDAAAEVAHKVQEEGGR